jgi:hypothetical protein
MPLAILDYFSYKSAMKLIPAFTFLSLLWFSAAAHAACPSLEGIYTNCGMLRGLQPPTFRSVKVSQKNAWLIGAPQYEFVMEARDSGTFSTNLFVANGQTIEAPAPADAKSSSKSMSRCEGEELLVDSEVKVPQFGVSFAMKQAVSRTPAGDLMFMLSLNGSRPMMVICKKQ